jgi:hypothetical protein
LQKNKRAIIWRSACSKGQNFMSRRVRAGVHTPHGCSERTGWFPEGSADAIAAMEELVKKQSTIFMSAWEYRDDTDPLDSSERDE